jgi:hypothetical protein
LNIRSGSNSNAIFFSCNGVSPASRIGFLGEDAVSGVAKMEVLPSGQLLDIGKDVPPSVAGDGLYGVE